MKTQSQIANAKELLDKIYIRSNDPNINDSGFVSIALGWVLDLKPASDEFQHYLTRMTRQLLKDKE